MSKPNGVYNPAITGIDENVAIYWNSPLSRKEAQKIFDDYTAATVQLQEKVLRLDFLIGYIAELLHIDPKDVQNFMDKKMAEFAERQKAANAG